MSFDCAPTLVATNMYRGLKGYINFEQIFSRSGVGRGQRWQVFIRGWLVYICDITYEVRIRDKPRSKLDPNPS